MFGDLDQGLSILIFSDLQLLKSIIVLLLLNLDLFKSLHVSIMLQFKFFFCGLLLGNNFLVLFLSELLLGLLLKGSVLGNLLGLGLLLDLKLSCLLYEELGLSLSLKLGLDSGFLLLDRLLLSFKKLLGQFFGGKVLLSTDGFVLLGSDLELSFLLFGLLELELVFRCLLFKSFLIYLSSSLLLDHFNGVSFLLFHFCGL